LINPQERDKIIEKLVDEIITYSKEFSDTGEYFEAGEFLCSAASMIEELNGRNSLKLYEYTIKLWQKQVESLKLQAKLHEIAEIYIKIADLYGEKLEDAKLEKRNILNAITYLKQESKLLIEFNEIRKLTHNYMNIAEMYLKVFNYKKTIEYFSLVIEIAKDQRFYDILSYSYHQIASSLEELDDFEKSNEIILDGIDYFHQLIDEFETTNDFLTIAQLSQALRKLYKLNGNDDQFLNFSKKEAGAYINLAEEMEKIEENFQRIARYYRGAALCYQEINNNLIESASCFVLAGNYSEKVEDYEASAVNFFNAAITFKEMNNLDMAYKNFIKAGDNYWKAGIVNDSTESYLNAIDIAVEGSLEYNQFGLFNQIVRGLNIIAKEGLKNKQFYIAATLILESIKYYQRLDTAKDFLLNEMVNNVYKYYYKAAHLKKIGKSHIVQSYILAATCSILNGKIDKARKILSEIEVRGNSVQKYIKFVNIIIKWVSSNVEVEFENFPYDIQRLIQNSEEVMYLLKLFKGFKLEV
jgi:tetratricopeptide (TPR) repeat protein